MESARGKTTARQPGRLLRGPFLLSFSRHSILTRRAGSVKPHLPRHPCLLALGALPAPTASAGAALIIPWLFAGKPLPGYGSGAN